MLAYIHSFLKKSSKNVKNMCRNLGEDKFDSKRFFCLFLEEFFAFCLENLWKVLSFDSRRFCLLNGKRYTENTVSVKEKKRSTEKSMLEKKMILYP